MKLSITESQKFDSLWFFVILALVSVINLIIYVYMKETDLTALVATYAMTIVGGLIFFFFRLDTRYDQNGIEYKFFPFHFKWHSIPWYEVKEAYIRKYKPLMEYGGWGIRYSKHGKAYTTRGNTGLQLKLKNGKSLLIGTQKPDEITYMIDKLKIA